MYLLEKIYFAICFVFFCVIPVNAYIDPSVATYAIQVLAGIAVAVGAVAGILWRKAKKKINDKLGIDENETKEVEDDIVDTLDSE